MGHIKTTELSNGNIGLEITYGGRECPFGGVDTSAPPAYIDPKCFTDCNGFIIVNDKLVAVNMAPASVPPLWGGTTGVRLIGFGNFYSVLRGTLNYALGYTSSAVSGTPTGVTYTFYMTSWSPSSVTTYWNDTLTETLYNSITPSVAASITTALSITSTTGAVLGSGAIVNITAVASLTSITTSDFYFELNGIISAITVTGGSGYSVGTTYWVEQGSNVTAQVIIASVGAGGAVTGVTIVSNAYTTTYINGSYVGVPVSVAGVNYSAGTATLVYAITSDVVLQITGPAGVATYSALSNGISTETPAYAGSGAWFYVEKVTQAGSLVNLFTLFGGPAFSDVAIVSVDILNGGVNYSVGQTYNLATGYTNPLAAEGFSFTSVNTLDTDVKFQVTSVGAGGTITGVNLVGTGIQDSYLPAPVVFNYYVVGASSPTPINSLVAATSYILNTLAEEINGLAAAPYNIADSNVLAVVNTLSNSLTLTAIIAGALGNSITVQDLSTITGTNPYYYYFPVRTATHLTGGIDGAGTSSALSLVLPSQASITSVGGTLYIGNIGPMIIKYGGPGLLTVSTTVQGMRILRKFAGSLIGLGLIPAPGSIVASTDMIFAWTASNALDVWNTLNLADNITGAGFNQLADIGDYLSGLVVSSGTAFILRAQGISYATATGDATKPFNWAHIGLGDQGEGAQIAALVCQYDQTGAYVGNTELYQISSTITSIGQKIKALLLSTLASDGVATAAASSVALGGDSLVALVFAAGLQTFSGGSYTTFFVYSPASNSWTLLKVPVLATGTDTLANTLLGSFASLNTHANTAVADQPSIILARQLNVGGSALAAPTFWALTEGLANANSLNAGSLSTFVTFPQEEIMFGRDITIDGLYISLYANVSENTVVEFLINDVSYATVTLTPAQFNTLKGCPIEMQLFSSTGVFTTHSPQLSCKITSITDAGTAQIRLVKLAMFGSFDPRQRPV